MKWMIALGCVLAALILWRVTQDKTRPTTDGSAGSTPAAANPRKSAAHSAIPASPAVVSHSGAESSTAAKLKRLYTPYLTTSRHPGYTNVLAVLQEISIEDPTATDLLKDACTYVAMLTDLAKHGLDMQGWHEKARQSIMLSNLTPEERTNSLQRFDSAPTQMDNIQQAAEAMTRVFAARFKQRHNLDPELVIPRLSALTLPDAGPELWLRCNEYAFPYKPRNPPRMPKNNVQSGRGGNLEELFRKQSEQQQSKPASQ